MSRQRRRLRVTGTVQGVGFRPFVYREASALGLSGHVANDAEGVIIEAEGPAGALDELARRILSEPPPLARVTALRAVAVPATGASDGFRIVSSAESGEPAVAVSVDVATCDDCLAELWDPHDRRYRYPFVNCTNCGPRYTITRSIPYDRATTTMAPFEMCDRCRAEYEDPRDRRFHAEPVACPACGPQLAYTTAQGEVLARGEDALAQAVAALEAGRIAGVKGLGGFHLAVDAGNEEAVGELRRRKARDDKPFALMVRDLAAARRLCHLTGEGEEVLVSRRRPIVLAPRRPGGAVAPGVAPGLPELGLMLPYTPLHHLLLGATGGPLVMTSGNLSDEPIAHEDDDARTRLGPLVDGLLTHDRGIHIRCDDSVVRVTGRGVQVLRRSRGYAPEPLPLPVPSPVPVLAVGAELKNTVAVTRGGDVIASHHIGDLEHLAAYRSFLQAVDHLAHLTRVTPQLVAHDLHPEYLSTKFALELDLPAVPVQHHHAHIASCLAEHGHRDLVLGIALDGLGFGTDGTVWGGELLLADLTGFQRVGHLRTVPLPGGNQAIREPWRMAVAWLERAVGPAAAERFGRGADERWRAVLSMVQHPDTLRTSSAGRLFDAVAAIAGLRRRVSYEAQAAIELEACAAGVPPEEADRYPADLAVEGGMLVVDPGPLVAAVVEDLDAGRPVAEVAAAFHRGFGCAVADAAAQLARRHGVGVVALSGGVFQNSRLAAVIAGSLDAAGLAVLEHRVVPPNDGGISIGQAAVAAACCSAGLVPLAGRAAAEG